MVSASAVESAFDSDAAAVHIHQLVNHGKANATALMAAATRTIDSMKALEDVREFVLGNSDAGIGDGQFNTASVRREAEFHFSA